MNTEIIWNDAVVSNNTNSKELGLAYELFKGNKYFISAKNKDKKAVVMFKNDKGQVATVIMQNQISDDFKEGKIKVSQLLSFPVILMDKLTDKDGNIITEEKTMWLGKPGQGWKDIVENSVVKVEDYESLATL